VFKTVHPISTQPQFFYLSECTVFFILVLVELIVLGGGKLSDNNSCKYKMSFSFPT